MLFHFVSLLVGGLIYVLFRTDSLVMFQWFKKLGIIDVVNYLRNYTLPISIYLPEWVLYSLPDGLWILSYQFLMLYIWKGNISKTNFIWLILLPMIAILSEIGQLFGVISGIFDWADILCYLIGFILPYIFLKKSINSKTILL